MTITPDNYLDFWNLLVNELVGSAFLFTILGLILVAYFGLRYRLPIEATMMFMILFVGVVVSYAYNQFLWMVVLLVVGVLIYSFLPKITRG